MNSFVLRSGRLAFLKSQQNKDGSFVSKTSESFDFARASDSDTIFLTSLILSSLASIPETYELKKIKQKALAFLLSQKSDHWSFNYWKKGSDKAKTLPYPDDLDDTFCALSALYQTDPKALNASALAKIVTLLTVVEEKDGGPYFTWIVPPDADKAWRDIDLAVNANVAYFLALQDIFLPNLRKFIYSKIKISDLASKYYPSTFPVIYFLSRYLSLDKKVPLAIKSKLQQEIMSSQMKDGSWGNPLKTALAVSSLLRLGVVPKMLARSIEMLEQEIFKNNWQAYTFCCDPVIGKKRYYAGSSALTAAFCLEAIHLFNIKNPAAAKPASPAGRAMASKQESQTKDKGNEICTQVIEKANERFSLLDTDLKKQALSVLSRTLKSDKDKQITLFPYYFCSSLDTKNQKKLKTNNHELIINLGLANLFGWMAYRIYDDFLDGEGKPNQLSVANVCLRELTTMYNGIIPEKFQEIMDMLDNANAWEVVHTKIVPDYGNYSQLADKSLGHALGPLAILTKLGYHKDSKEVKQFLSFFRHYIIARQLNDDAHDWEEDLARGQINAVGAMVLTKTKDKSKLREVFWQEVIQEVCQIILEHIREARSALPLLSSLLAPIEKSAQKAIDEQKEAVAFMREYNKSPAWALKGALIKPASD